MAPKVDHKRTLPCYRATRDAPALVEVPDLQYLMLDGSGDPNSLAFDEAVSTLYPVAFRTKFASKHALGRDYVVMPLEGLWWADDMDRFTENRDKSQWCWTLMIMVPDWITGEMVSAAVDGVATTDRPAPLNEVRLETLREGRCVQALHVGSYDDEAELLRRMHHDVIPGHDLTVRGRHHEIYLSDARRTPPAKLRTILRQPVAPLGG